MDGNTDCDDELSCKDSFYPEIKDFLSMRGGKLLKTIEGKDIRNMK